MILLGMDGKGHTSHLSKMLMFSMLSRYQVAELALLLLILYPDFRRLR